MTILDIAINTFEELIACDPLALDADGRAVCGCHVDADSFSPCSAHAEQISAITHPEGPNPC